jgi:hypothetical protein
MVVAGLSLATGHFWLSVPAIMLYGSPPFLSAESVCVAALQASHTSGAPSCRHALGLLLWRIRPLPASCHVS